MSSALLYYVLDPMCSWCWGFRPEFEALCLKLPAGTRIRYVMGGLATDSDEPMDPQTRSYVQGAWDAVEARTGARFNRDFWSRCKPRRSTYPACRAVIAASELDEGGAANMIEAIQHAYYRDARNPSDNSTLIALAVELGLDEARFSQLLTAPETEAALQADLALCLELGVSGFPSLVLEHDKQRTILLSGYGKASDILKRLETALATTKKT